MSTDYSSLTATVIDTGISTAQAERLSRDFGKVYYWTPYNTQKPHVMDWAPGYGMGKIIKEKTISFHGRSFSQPIKAWDCIEESDLIFFTDVGWGDWQRTIRKYMPSKRVFGPNMADIMEEDRYFFKTLQQYILKLPTQKYARVAGVDGLRRFLKSHNNVWVKLNQFRGDRETFHAYNVQKTDNIIDKISVTLGPMKSVIPFIIEEEIKNGIVEYGFDLFFNGKKFITPYLWGIEAGSPYIGKFSDSLPPTLQKITDSLAPVLERMNYRGAISCEEILVSKNKGYFLDFTSRFAQPLSTMYTEVIKNYTDVIWAVAGGEDVTIEPISTYTGCLSVHSEEARESSTQLFYDKKFSRLIKPYLTCEVEGERYALKGEALIASLISWGTSPKDVAGKLKRLLKEIDADGIEKDITKLYSILEDFKKLADIGIKF